MATHYVKARDLRLGDQVPVGADLVPGSIVKLELMADGQVRADYLFDLSGRPGSDCELAEPDALVEILTAAVNA